MSVRFADNHEYMDPFCTHLSADWKNSVITSSVHVANPHHIVVGSLVGSYC